MEINQFIDHTLLNPLATEKEIEQFCVETIQNNFKGICLHSRWISLAKVLLAQSGHEIAAVADFPFGASLNISRLKQIEYCLLEGATEIDLVAPLNYINENNWEALFKDILSARQLIGTRGKLKVIIEVSLFSAEQIIQASRICGQASVYMVKTSTGIINKRPTQIKDIELIKEGLIDFPDVQIKASAGIKTYEQAAEFINAGVTRLGTSSALNIINESKFSERIRS